MKILVTGAAGFIGYHVSELLLQNGHEVVGIDNINDYYNPQLKYDRLAELGIDQHAVDDLKSVAVSSKHGSKFKFLKISLEDSKSLNKLFAEHRFEAVCNLAAQVGVRYSLKNPGAYVSSNMVGFMNILECCKNNSVEHLVYASSSSVYGLNKKIPFTVNDNVDQPISIYAASKKSNELMAHTYSHLYGLQTTGLRFFTVYGPWGRPDMAMFLFTEAIATGKPLKVFNHGQMKRDFTYVQDIAQGIYKVLTETKDLGSSRPLYKVYNIGNTKSVNLLDFIEEIEKNLNKEAVKEMLPMQPGDVENTWADVSELIKDYKYQPSVSVKEGVKSFVKWYQIYYGK